MRQKVLCAILVLSLCLSFTSTRSLAKATDGSKKEVTLVHLASYSTGTVSPDGGVAEIVQYNADNKKMYIVNGITKTVDIVKINKDGSTAFNQATDRIDVSGMIPGFQVGDITSVDVNTAQKVIAVAVQAADYPQPGAIVFLDYDGRLLHSVIVGVQPDMVTFTPDGNYVLAACEGEPRNGYKQDALDPQGSVAIVDLKNGVKAATVTVVTFDGFDSRREELVGRKVILKKGALPSRDLEPEYIAVSADSRKAYVSLQEANAIATVDIGSKAVTAIKGLGFKNHLLDENAVDVVKDKKIAIEPQELFGVYMPDGIATYEKNGKTYILTANEGDSREWGGYENLTSALVNGQKVDVLKNAEHDGLEDGKQYLPGGRSFAIWDAATMQRIFDSSSDFERITAAKYPDNFNCSNKDTVLDSRSGKKGPEPEDVKVGKIGGQVYAFIGLERIGGIMVYNITEPANAYFVDYINSRDFSSSIAGDVSPEGLCFVPAEKSPTGKPLLIAAHEVSGTVAFYEVR